MSARAACGTAQLIRVTNPHHHPGRFDGLSFRHGNCSAVVASAHATISARPFCSRYATATRPGCQRSWLACGTHQNDDPLSQISRERGSRAHVHQYPGSSVRHRDVCASHRVASSTLAKAPMQRCIVTHMYSTNKSTAPTTFYSAVQHRSSLPCLLLVPHLPSTSHSNPQFWTSSWFTKNALPSCRVCRFDWKLFIAFPTEHASEHPLTNELSSEQYARRIEGWRPGPTVYLSDSNAMVVRSYIHRSTSVVVESVDPRTLVWTLPIRRRKIRICYHSKLGERSQIDADDASSWLDVFRCTSTATA